MKSKQLGSWMVGVAVGAVMLASCAQRASTDSSAGDSQAPVASQLAPAAPGTAAAGATGRPPNVPAGYVATPFGWFAPDCVHELADTERVDRAGRVTTAGGAYVRTDPACTSPRYSHDGVEIPLIAPAAPPPAPPPSAGCTNSDSTCWVEDAIATVDYIGSVSATWNVPPAPAVLTTGEMIYLFPGTIDTGSAILQPVLGWNQANGVDGAPAGWSVASWNCCNGSGPYHSAYVAVTGTTVSATMTGAGCGSNGNCTTWTEVTKDNASGHTTTYTGAADGHQDQVFGGALEMYNVTDCTGLPTTDVTFSSIVVKNTAGTTITPAWTAEHRAGSSQPACGYSVTSSASSVTINWTGWVCDPGDDIACCPYPDGCSCDGDKECNANGKWGACEGAGEKGHPCP